MKRRSLILMAALSACITACAAPAMDGAGMIVTFRNVINGKALLFDTAISANGIGFPNPGSLSPQADPQRGGATIGAAPDGRALPEWVEFSWKEWPYPGSPMPKNQEAVKLWNEGVHAMSRSLPRKIGRVFVRNRVPQDIVTEVMESNRHRELGKTSEKKLWVYFIWYEHEIRFRWELAQGCCTVLRSGGDQL